MNKKNFKRVLLLVVLLAVGINVILPSMLFGYHMITGMDEIRLFDKGKSVAEGRSDIYHKWDEPDVIDAYPPGYPIIVSEILIMMPGTDVFDVSYMLRILLMIPILLSYAWLGLYLSRSVAIFAIIFRATLFTVPASYPTYYVYLYPSSLYLSGNIYTEISVILTFIFLIKYFKNDGSDARNLSIIFILSLLHALTHISGFFNFIFFLLALLITFQIVQSFRDFFAKKNTIWETISSFFFSRLMKAVYVIMLIPLLAFLTFFINVFIELTNEVYNFEVLLPISVPLIVYLISALILFFVGIAFLSFMRLKRKSLHASDDLHAIIPTGKIKKILPFAYLAIFCLIVLSVNLTPDRFVYSTFSINTGFPSKLPSNISLVGILSYLAGVFIFILSFFGLKRLLNEPGVASKCIALFYFGGYLFYAVVFLTGIIIPHRSLFFLLLLPILLASSLGELRSIWTKFILRYIKGFSVYLFRISKELPTIVLALILIIAIAGRINMDPAVSETVQTDSAISIGSFNPPIITYGLLEAVKEYYIPGQAILSTPETQATLFACLHDMYPRSPSYNVETTHHTLFYEAYTALFSVSGNSPDKWLEKNNGTLIVIGFTDVNAGSISYGRLSPPVENLDKNHAFKIVYNDEFGQRVYSLNVTV